MSDEYLCGTCHVRQCETKPPDGPGICSECCAHTGIGHDYEYQRGEREWRCNRCWCEPPPDWFDVDPEAP